MSNIAQVVEMERNLTTFKKGMEASGLNQVLSGEGPFTVFAPTDLAFNKLEGGTIKDLLLPENKRQLTNLLNHHVICGKISFRDLTNGGKLKTLNGKELLVRVIDGKTCIDGSTIHTHDIQTSNGVIHCLDTVLRSN